MVGKRAVAADESTTENAAPDTGTESAHETDTETAQKTDAETDAGFPRDSDHDVRMMLDHLLTSREHAAHCEIDHSV